MESARRMMDADTASAALGIELMELGEGRAVCHMTVTDQMSRPDGQVVAEFRGRSREST
ncbi:hypothetical protein [Nonomuraea sp. B1E8]|uniref:hypothetical protein n=1 Tax=unclassified Nonomuraea TaxID=2593643 RepID=UPI00325D669D